MSKEVELSFLDVSDLMKMSTYDTDQDGIVDISERLEDAGVPDGVFYGKEGGQLGFYTPTISSITSIDDVDLSTATSGDLLQYDNGNIVPIDPASLRTNILPSTTGKDGQILVVNSGDYVLQEPSLYMMENVKINTLQDGDSLVYNATSGMFENAQIETGTSIDSINDISDVNAGSPSTGDVLRYDGTTWLSTGIDYNTINNTPTLSTVATSGSYNDLSDTPTIPDEFSGDYNDLVNTPTIPSNIEDLSNVSITGITTGQLLEWDGATFIPVDKPSAGGTEPTLLGELSNVDTNGVVANDVLMYSAGSWITSKVSYNDLSDTPDLFSGSYNDLTDTPAVPTNIEDLANVSTSSLASGEYIRYNGTNFVNSTIDYSDIVNTPTLFSGSYNDLSDTPSIPSSISDMSDVNTSGISSGQVLQWDGSGFVAASVSAGGAGSLNELSDVSLTSATNGEYLKYDGTRFINSTIDYSDIVNTPALFSGSYNDLSDTPALFSGSYNDLSDTPALFSGSYNDLSDTPALFSGSYNDLTDTPSIPSSISDLSDVGYMSLEYGDFLRYDGALFTTTKISFNELTDAPTIAESINDLNDVDTTGITSGQVLQWNGTGFVAANVSSGDGATAINDLNDVDTTGASDGDLLGYESSSNSWKPISGGLGGGGSTMKIEYVRIQFDDADDIYEDGIQTTDGVRVEVIDAAACRWRVHSDVYKYPPMSIYGYAFNGNAANFSANTFTGGEYSGRALVNSLGSGIIVNKDNDSVYTRGDVFGNFNVPSTSDPQWNRYSVSMYTLPPDWGINHVSGFTGDFQKYGDLWFMFVFGE